MKYLDNKKIVKCGVFLSIASLLLALYSGEGTIPMTVLSMLYLFIRV